MSAPSSPAEEQHQQAIRLLEAGRNREALELLKQAIEADPTHEGALHNFAVASARCGELAEAIGVFRELVSEHPERVESHRNLAIACEQAGQIEAAEEAYRGYAQHTDHSIRAVIALASFLRRHNRSGESAQLLSNLAEQHPNEAEVLHELGLAYSDGKQFNEAKAALVRAVAIDENYASAWNNLGVLFLDNDRPQEAVSYLKKAASLEPASEEILNNVGVALAEVGAFAESVEWYRRTVAVNPENPQGYNNLGNALRSEGKIEEAVRCLEHAVTLRPDYAEAYNNLGICLVQAGRQAEAMRAYDRALYFKPNYAEAHMNRGLALLGTGQFEEGWTEYEWRWKSKEARGRHARRFGPRHWDGGPLDGKSIWVYYEQGMGDTLQFVRYLQLLKRQGATVILEVQKILHPLLSRCGWIDRLVEPTNDPPDADYHAPLMGLPAILGTALDSIPAEVPYIEPAPERVEKWKKRIDLLDGLTIGIAWQGNPQYRGDRLRSLPLEMFRPLAEVPGVRLISLQKGYGAEQLEKVDFDVVQFEDLDESGGAFEDTAAVMKCVDLVITSDTAIPHLAGALGVPVWVALPASADWRWLSEQDDSPWYPTMRLFRQSELGNWTDVFERLAHAVGQRFQAEQATSDDDREEAQALYQKGLEEFQSQKPSEAEASLRAAIERDPSLERGHHDLGVLLASTGRTRDAIEFFRTALHLNAHFGRAYRNLGLAYLETGRNEDAVFNLRQAISEGEREAQSYHMLGVAYFRQGLSREAIEAFEKALRMKPDFAEAHLFLGRTLLRQGTFRKGWHEYQWRWEAGHNKDSAQRKLPWPRWGGGELGGQRILLWADEGLSETLLALRYLPLIEQMGGRIYVECSGELAPLLQGLAGIQVLVRGEPLPTVDVQLPTGCLHGLFDTTIDTIPVEFPSFETEDRGYAWTERIRTLAGLRIGMAWRDDWGSAHVPLKHWEPILQRDDLHLVSLQKHALADEDQVGKPAAFADLHELAALIRSLDLVIATDGVVAHLAGVLGVPVWLALPKVSHFCWLEDREDSPWYPSVRLFRQQVAGRWDNVFERIAAGLTQLAGAKESTLMPSQAATSEMQRGHELHREGIEWISKGRLDLAESSLRRAIGVIPTFAQAHHDLGVVYARRGHRSVALRCFEQALKHAPDLNVAHKNLAFAYVNEGRYHEAMPHLNQVLTRQPDLIDAHNLMGICLAETGNPEEAIAQYQAGLARKPDVPELHNNLGNTLKAQGKPEEALQHYQRAIDLRPRYAEAHNNRGSTLMMLGQLKESLACYREAIRLKPDYAEAHNNLGVALADLHENDEAIESFQQAISLRPDHAETHRNAALLLLMQGRLEEGWAEYEWRLHAGDRPVGDFPYPRWDGGMLPGGTLLVQAEQGLGDTLQFCRYLPLVKERCRRLIFRCQRPLLALLQSLDVEMELMPTDGPMPPADAYVPLLSLPFIFQTHLENIPAATPYLKAEQQRVERWQARLRSDRPNVAIAWQGQKSYPGDVFRSFRLEEFAPISELDVELVSVQKGDGAEQVDEVDFPVTVFSELDGEAPFLDTAAVLECADVVICADTAIAHLAGALNRPTWVPLCLPNDWRWMRNREDSPWYPEMRLFRQTRWKKWRDVFARISEELRAFLPPAH